MELPVRFEHLFLVPFLRKALGYTTSQATLKSRAKNGKIHAILYHQKTAGFSLNDWLNELRIRLADTTHVAITLSEISDFNLRQLGLLGKTVFLAFF